MRTSSRSIPSILAISPLLLGTLIGCGQGKTDFANAIPDAEMATMDAPGVESSARTSSSATQATSVPATFDYAVAKASIQEEEVESAQCYDGTVELATTANNTVRYVLNALDTITDNPYTMVDEDTYLWGPWLDEEKGLSKQLLVTDMADGSYVYSYQAAAAASQDFLDIVTGVIDAGSTRTIGSGSFLINQDNREVLEPTGTLGGTMAYTYEQDAEKNRTIDVALTDYLFDNGERSNAQLFFDRASDSTGQLDWFRSRDVTDDGSGEALKEDVAYRSRWLADHSGRCDGQLKGGDFGTHVVTTHQCWDVSTAEVYYQSERDAAVYTTRGDVSLCAFSDTVYAGE